MRDSATKVTEATHALCQTQLQIESQSQRSHFSSSFQPAKRSFLLGSLVAVLFGAQAHALSDSLADVGAVSDTPFANAFSSLFSSKNATLSKNSAAFANNQASSTENRDVVLHWQAAYNATHYRVEQSTDGGQAFVPLEPVDTTQQALSLAPGVYHFRVAGCIQNHRTLEVLCDGVGQYSGVLEFDTASNGDNNATLDWAQLANSSSTAVPSVALPAITPSTTNFYGATPGEAGVSGGAAVYNVPITVLPGRNGMQPAVSLNYNSRNGNGIAGVGFGLSAGGSISRCPATLAQDNANISVDYTDTDKLCLDGQRLMVVSGSYGANNAVYRTEIESLLSVKQTGDMNGTGSATASFAVSTPSGTVRRYGFTADSRVVATNKTQTFSWLLDREQDVSGNNHITYQYTNLGDGEVLLSDILYTGNGTVDGDRKVSFEYENRAQFATQYLAGGKTRTTRRLSNISTWYSNTKIRDYTLTYGTSSPASGRSLLRSVQECGYVNSTGANQTLCREATAFNWSDSAPAFNVEVFAGSTGANSTQEIFPSHHDVLGQPVLNEFRASEGDMNGDGVRDWPGFEVATNGQSSGQITDATFFLNAEGELTGQTDVVVKQSVYDPANFAYHSVTADINLDGRTDHWQSQNGVLVIGYTQELTPGSFSVDYSGTTNIPVDTTNSREAVAFASDFNADGWPDIVIRRETTGANGLFTASYYLHLHTQNDANPYQPQTSAFFTEANTTRGDSVRASLLNDMNGDGRPDMLIARQYPEQSTPVNETLLLSQLSGNTLSFTGHNVNFGNAPTNSTGHYSAFIDVNADGFADWVGWVDFDKNQDNTLKIKFNLGNGQFGPLVDTGYVLPFELVSPIGGAGSDQLKERYTSIGLGGNLLDVNNDGRPEILVPGSDAADIVVEHCITVMDYSPTGTRSVDICGNDFGVKQFRTSDTSDQLSVLPKSKDRSIRKLKALTFIEDSSGNYRIESRDTDLVGSRGQTVIDAYGKGLMDVIFGYGCMVSVNCFYRDPVAGSVMENAALNTYYVSRNYGAAASLGITDNFAATDYVPVDMLLGVDNGLRTTSSWVHKPLSSDQYHVTHTDSSTPYYQTNFTEVVDGAPQGEQIHFASSMYTVAEFTTTDSSNVQQHKRFAYDGAVYNLQGRGFRGFNGITEIDLTNGLTTYTDFKQTFPFSSAIEKQYVFEGGSAIGDSPEANGVDVYDSTNRSEALRELTQTWRENPNQQASWKNAGVYQLFSAEQTTINRVLSNDTLALGTEVSRISVTQAGTDTDQYGNAEKRTTTITDSFGTYTTEEAADYSQATDAWPNRYESRTVTKKTVIRTSGITDVAEENDENKAVKTSITWDTTHRKPDVVTVSIGSSANNATTDITTTDTDYNSYGLPISITVTGDVINGISDTSSREHRVTTTTYSKTGTAAAADGYFPLVITQQATSTRNHSTTTHTNPHTGLPTSVTDIAGVVTSTAYDSLARPVTINRTGFPAQHIRYRAITNDSSTETVPNEVLEKAVMSIDIFQAGTPNTREFKDSSGRALRLATVGFNGNEIYQDTHYNSRGLMISGSQPYYPAEQTANSTVPATVYSNFDALGRVQQKQSPQIDGTMVTDYTYNGLTTNIDVTPSKNASSTLSLSRTYNALEQLVRTEDANNGITQYAYDGAGNPIVIEDASNNRIVANHDALGRKLWVDDPNQGRTDFTYNDFGELEKEIDANGDIIRFDMDKLGRVTSRIVTPASSATNPNSTVTASTASFVWDTRKHGLLTSQSENGSTQSYQYDNAARITSTTTTIDGSNYVVQTQYDENFGRPLSLSYPGADSNANTSSGGLKIKYQYNNHGYLSHEKNAQSDFIYREITEQDVFGNIKAANLNAGTLTGDYVYSGRTGQMLHSRVQQNSTNLHYLGYTDYDGYGNLAQQTNHMLTSATEDYTYDKLHRLTQSSITLSGATSNIDYAYDAVGNITKKTDYSANSNNAYTYSNGTNQIAQITLKDNSIVTFGYDNKGNQTHRNNTREVTYNVFNKPTHIAKNATDITLSYGADLARFKQTRIVDGETITTHYIDKLYEVELKSGKRINKSYISDVAILTHDEETGFTLAFTHRDRLGSAATFTDHNNQVTARRHLDPFGKPRGGDWSQLENLTLAATLGNNPLDGNMDTRRGFTDHEHLDEAEIIHMNGRVYDYNVGRFMSVDPVIQSPENSQSINPYSYIMNNPLSGTDPSGYSSIDEKKKKVSVTGSRIKREQTTRTTVSEDGTVTTRSTASSADGFFISSTSFSLNANNGSASSGGEGSKTTTTSSANPDTMGQRETNAGGEGNGSTNGDSNFGIDDAASLGVGFTPAGLAADAYTAATGEDFFTNEEVEGIWRWLGIVPFVGEARKLGNAAEAAEEGIAAIRKGSEITESAFGAAIQDASRKTKLQYQGQSIYEVTKNTKMNGFKLRKGDYYYVDGLHKDHIEIFDNRGKARGVLNLDGTLNTEKSKKAMSRSIEKLLR